MADLIVSHIGTDIGDGSVGVEDHVFGSVEAVFIYILDGGHVSVFFKEGGAAVLV